MGRTIKGTNGNDRITQGRETELKIFGLGGNDTIFLNRSDDLGGGNRVDAGNGNDKVANLKEGDNIILLGKGNDEYAGTGFASFASERGDVVSGGAGKDTFAFETAKSTYNGDGGNDVFFSSGWENTINGGSGKDTISYAFRHEDEIASRSGGVTVDLLDGAAQTGSNRFERLIAIENVVGSQMADVIGGTDGENMIAGLGGADTLAGRGGADTFVYNSINDSRAVAGQIDLILDFENGIDKIDLRGLATGNARLTFSNNDSFSGTRGEVVFSQGGVFVDVDGDRKEDFAIDMNGLTSMSRGDFIL